MSHCPTILVHMFDTTSPDPLDLASLSTDELGADLVAAAQQVAASTARCLLIIAELERRNIVEAWEMVSMAQFVAWQTGVSLSTAREHVRVARALQELPQVTHAFCAGQISYAKVRALTSFAVKENEDDMLELARHTTAAQLERIASARRRITDEQACSAEELRYLATFLNADGSVTLKARLPAADAATVMAAIQHFVTDAERRRAGAEPRSATTGKASPRPPDEPIFARQADGLVAIAETALAAEPPEDASTARVHVHLDLAQLAGSQGAGTATEGDASHVPGISQVGAFATARATLLRLCCDGEVDLALDHADGSTTKLGRSRRLVSGSLRRRLFQRDRRSCQFPGCRATRYLHAHHLQPWHAGGTTDLDNLLVLCSLHHRFVHERGWRLESDQRGRWRAISPSGVVYEPDPMAVADKRARAAGVQSASFRDIPPIDLPGSFQGSGERMDLRYVIDVLMHNEEIRLRSAEAARSA